MKANFIYRRLGYEIDQKDYFIKYIQNVAFWSEHIRNTRTFILNQLKKISKKEKIAILGSGHCVDIPIMEISREFANVDLIDIFHPLKTKLRIKNFNNINLINEDISQIIEQTYYSTSHYKNFDIEKLICSTHYNNKGVINSLNQYDYVCSVNLLGFMPDNLISYLMSNELIDEFQAKRLTNAIVEHHKNILPKEKSLIITPTKKIIYTNNNLVKSEKTIIELKEEIQNSWLWTFENNKSEKICYNVVAINL